MTKPRIAIALGALLALSVLIAALTTGIGHASVPSDAVATVNGQKISRADFNRALTQAALSQGLQQVPSPTSSQYTAVKDQALGNLLDIAWIQGEAQKQGVSVSDRQVADQFAATKQHSFKTEADYQKFLTQSGFTQADVNLRVKLQLLSQMIQQKVSRGIPPVSDSEVQSFYNSNSAQFKRPQQRNIRIVLNTDKTKVVQALKLLQANNSSANWQKVAAQFSTDASSKSAGGVRQSITPGVLEGNLDKAVFSAPQGQVSSDIVQTPLGYYVFQVDQITPASTQPLSAVQSQLKQQLTGQRQQEAFSAFILSYRNRWTAATICAQGFVIDRCENFAGTVFRCATQQAKQVGCPPPVVGRSPLPPGGAASSPLGASAFSSIPQRPHPPGSGPGPTGTPGSIGAPGGASGAGPAGAGPAGASPAGPSSGN